MRHDATYSSTDSNLAQDLTPPFHIFRVIRIGEFFPIFRHFFAQFLNLPYFPVFFSKYWNVNELGIFGYGKFHEQRQNASVY